MAGLLHFTLLLFLHCGSFVFISTVDSDAAFTLTGNSTKVPTTGVYSKTTTEPPKTTATTDHHTGGKTTTDRAATKEEEEEEEGPLELGECVSSIYFDFYILEV